MSRLRSTTATLLGCLILAGVAACGVPLQSTAEPLPSNVLPAPLRVPSPLASAAPSPSASASLTPAPEPTPSRLRLWFVQDDGLAAVESSLPEGAAPDIVVQSLAVGPTDGQSAEGLRTVARDPLTGIALVSVAPQDSSPAASALGSPAPSPQASAAATGPPPESATPAAVTVQLSTAFTALPPSEQVLLLGQVVLSLTGSGLATVAFTDEAGTPLAVPLPDGRLLDVPATARDYTGLIVRP